MDGARDEWTPIRPEDTDFENTWTMGFDGNILLALREMIDFILERVNPDEKTQSVLQYDPRSNRGGIKVSLYKEAV